MQPDPTWMLPDGVAAGSTGGPPSLTRDASGLASVLHRNIQALRERRREERANAGAGSRIADAMTRFAGSMAFVLLHLTLVAAWVAWNSGLVGLKPFDPTFVILATTASVEAIFISTFVLIAQNRAATEADRRADLDLQINLLAEHEITHLLKITAAIADRLGIAEAQAPELTELKRVVVPEAVLERIEEGQKDLDAES
jgi:uncharacterized membrane protein